MISFAAAAQFGPALVGGLYWRRGNKTGAITGIVLGFIFWFYTLMIPSLIKSGWWQTDLLRKGPFGHRRSNRRSCSVSPGSTSGPTLFSGACFSMSAHTLPARFSSPKTTWKSSRSTRFVDVFEEAEEEDVMGSEKVLEAGHYHAVCQPDGEVHRRKPIQYRNS